MFAQVFFRVLVVLKQQAGRFQEPGQRLGEGRAVTVREGHAAGTDRIGQPSFL